MGKDPVFKYLCPMLLGNIPSFLGMPIAREKSELSGADVAFLGIPYQNPGRTSSPPTAEVGTNDRSPDGLRTLSLRYGGYLPELDLDLLEHVKIVDYGNARIDVSDHIYSFANIEEKVGDIVDAGCFPVTIGGNAAHASYPVIKSIAKRTKGSVGVINMDAHGDNYEQVGGEPFGGPAGDHGVATHVARWLLDLENVHFENHVQIGMVGPRNTSYSANWFRKNGAHLYHYGKIRELGIDQVIKEAIEIAHDGTERVWLSIDFDIIGYSIPGWAPEPLGLSIDELLKLCYKVGESGLDGLTFMAFPNVQAVHRAVIYAIMHTLAGVVKQRSK
jgi:agmatinase